MIFLLDLSGTVEFDKNQQTTKIMQNYPARKDLTKVYQREAYHSACGTYCFVLSIYNDRSMIFSHTTKIEKNNFKFKMADSAK